MFKFVHDLVGGNPHRRYQQSTKKINHHELKYLDRPSGEISMDESLLGIELPIPNKSLSNKERMIQNAKFSKNTYKKSLKRHRVRESSVKHHKLSEEFMQKLLIQFPDEFVLLVKLCKTQQSGISQLNKLILYNQVMNVVEKAIFNIFYFLSTCVTITIPHRLNLFRGMNLIPTNSNFALFKSFAPSEKVRRRDFYYDKPIIFTDGFWGFSSEINAALYFTDSTLHFSHTHDEEKNVLKTNRKDHLRVLFAIPNLRGEMNALPGDSGENEYVFGPGTRFQIFSSEIIESKTIFKNDLNVLILYVTILQPSSQCSTRIVKDSVDVISKYPYEKIQNLITGNIFM